MATTRLTLVSYTVYFARTTPTASTIIGLVIELRLDKCRGARRAGARFTTLVQIRPKKTEPALTALRRHLWNDLMGYRRSSNSGKITNTSRTHIASSANGRCSLLKYSIEAL